ncbi:MAG: LPS export ABC transporter periplasmic protein LptC [Bacteroidales bacterium]|nr:LPS export ABC transporter periplasmic protein LptC [Bacteroidales bacterium]OQA92739.1 MAG: Lipopolysaccharide-assembly, LptC-related [Bacteroidetes bacterium ADurb.Bin234]
MFRIVVLSTTILCFLSCKNDIAVVNQLLESDTIPDEIAKNIHMFISEAGVVTHEFKAPVLFTFHKETTYQECPNGFEIITYNSRKEKQSKLTALYGINHEDENRMEAKRKVVINNFETGEIIETEHLIWDLEKKLIYSNTQIKQTKSDGSIYMGERFESDESLNKYVIYNARLIFYEKE